MRLDTPCVEFAGRRNDRGYGVVRRDGRDIKAHRDAWERANGPIPEGLVVCHVCDNPPCVNVSHLFLGTRSDNNRDRAGKGRSKGTFRPGPDHPRFKVGPEAIDVMRSMRSDGTAQRVIADLFGVSRAHVARLTAGAAPKNMRGVV